MEAKARAIGVLCIRAIGCVPFSKRIAKKGVFMIAFKRTAVMVATGLVSALGTVSAFAVDPATGLEAVGAVSTGLSAYGPPMFGLAVLSVGILVGVKWIKRAKGAA